MLPFKVSAPLPLLFNTLPALGLPVVPLPPAIASSWAIIAGGVTVTVTVAGSQLVGFNFSHKLYTIVYVPAGVPAGTETCPVNGSITGTGFPFIGVAGVVTVILTWEIRAWTPFKVSEPLPLLLNTFPIFGFPVVPLPPERASFWATIAAAETETETVAVSQLVGLKTSQIW